MRVLPSPVSLQLRTWRDAGTGQGWQPFMATSTRFLPDPGEFLDIGQGQCFEVRHLGADVSVGGDQVIAYGGLVPGPPQ